MSLRKKCAKQDVYDGFGYVFRAISALNQVIFALNWVYWLNGKKALK